MGVLDDQREEASCVNRAVRLMGVHASYAAAGYKDDEKHTNSTRFFHRPHIQARLKELKEENLSIARQDTKENIEKLHNPSLKALEKGLKSSNEYVAIASAKTVLARTAPVVNQSTSIRVTISDNERSRRKAVLDKYSTKITDVTPITKQIEP